MELSFLKFCKCEIFMCNMELLVMSKSSGISFIFKIRIRRNQR